MFSIYCTVSPLVLAASTIWFFNGQYKPYRPSVRSIDFSKAKDLFNLGVKFFIIQIAAILLYQTNAMIIAQLFGPAMVTPYNVAFKYFGVLMMGFMIIVSPFWGAFIEAWTKQDIAWIQNIIKRLMKLWLVIVAIGLIMLVFSGFIFHAWIGKTFAVPILISVLTLSWVLINAWNGIFSNFLNGVGKLRIQLYLGISAALINIPLALLLGKYMGIAGVLLANVILGLTQVVIYPLQYRKILSNKATGNWNK
jgi:O-antigen/teichoic acid export membrane protein